MERMPGSRRARIAIPVPIQRPQPHPFPVLATIAPVVMSVVLFVVTRSPFALAFAALGPLVAVATVVDSRLQARRRRRSERERFDRELEVALEAVDRAHAAERAELDLATPSAAELRRRGERARWTARPTGARVTLGRGGVPSTLDLDPPAVHGEEEQQFARLAATAAVVADAPVDVAATSGIGIVGPSHLAGAVARGVLLQVAMQVPPSAVRVVVGVEPPPTHWLQRLPHPVIRDERLGVGVVCFRDGIGPDIVIAVAPEVDALTIPVGTIVEVGARSRLLKHPVRAVLGPLDPELVSLEQAREWADELGHRARVESETVLRIPDAVPLAAVLSTAQADRRSLAVPIGADAERPVEVDLVRDGPHAIVGGTTGSGKSELLVSWVLGLAWRYPPSRVTFLLVDFKGGASFAPLEALPHCVGVISDLDESGALRALESLRAEVRHRERTIADARVRSIEELPDAAALPRLVIVVDEFAAMVAGFPELHHLFADLAARGRSLGLHLVLCTQRPAGAVRDAVLANAGLRISLRVNNRADSQAVIGTADAAELPADPPGRALLSASGAPPALLQVPLATEDDARAVADLHPLEVVRRPWLDPLPARIPLDELPSADGIVFGLLDHPHEQAQPPAVWSPEADGHLFVIGAGRSGRSTLLATVGAASGCDALLLGSDVEAAWDEVHRRLSAVREGRGGGLLLVDDLDALVARLGDEHASAFVDTLAALLREGRRVGQYLVITTQRLLPALHPIAALCDARLLLRTASRQDHVLAGGDGTLWSERGVAGSGTWQGNRVQVAITDAVPPPAVADLESLEPVVGSHLAVVSGSPRAMADRLTAGGFSVTRVEPGSTDPTALEVRDGDAPTAIVGDAESWQARWGAFPALAAVMPVFFHGCAPADYRALTRSRVVPPPIVASTDAGHLLRPDGSVTRARVNAPAAQRGASTV